MRGSERCRGWRADWKKHDGAIARATVVMLTLAFAGLGAPESLTAQVALPSLFPPVPRIGDPLIDIPQTTMLPENPAAMQWGPLRAAGTGLVNSNRSATGTDSDEALTWYTAAKLHSRVIDYNLTLIWQSGPSGANALVLGGGGSGAIGDTLAVGGSAFHLDRDYTLGEKLETVSTSIDATTLGASLNAGGGLFLGAAYGKESLRSSHASNTDTDLSFSAERDVLKSGVGLRFGDDKRPGGHLEYYRIVKQPYEVDGEPYGDSATDYGVLEIRLGKIVVGATAFRGESSSANSTTQGTYADVGWDAETVIDSYLHYESITVSLPGEAEITITTFGVVIAGALY